MTDGPGSEPGQADDQPRPGNHACRAADPPGSPAAYLTGVGRLGRGHVHGAPRLIDLASGDRARADIHVVGNAIVVFVGNLHLRGRFEEAPIVVHGIPRRGVRAPIIAVVDQVGVIIKLAARAAPAVDLPTGRCRGTRILSIDHAVLILVTAPRKQRVPADPVDTGSSRAGVTVVTVVGLEALIALVVDLVAELPGGAGG